MLAWQAVDSRLGDKMLHRLRTTRPFLERFTLDCIPKDQNVGFIIRQILKIGVLKLSSDTVRDLETKYARRIAKGDEDDKGYRARMKALGLKIGSHSYPPPGEKVEIE